MFRVSIATPKDVILGELKMILSKAQALAQDKTQDTSRFNFSIYLEVSKNETLPAINLRIQNAKLHGQDVSLFNKLGNRAQYACKSWHVEVASKFGQEMEELVQKRQGLRPGWEVLGKTRAPNQDNGCTLQP